MASVGAGDQHEVIGKRQEISYLDDLYIIALFLLRYPRARDGNVQGLDFISPLFLSGVDYPIKFSAYLKLQCPLNSGVLFSAKARVASL